MARRELPEEEASLQGLFLYHVIVVDCRFRENASQAEVCRTVVQEEVLDALGNQVSASTSNLMHRASGELASRSDSIQRHGFRKAVLYAATICWSVLVCTAHTYRRGRRRKLGIVRRCAAHLAACGGGIRHQLRFHARDKFAEAILQTSRSRGRGSRRAWLINHRTVSPPAAPSLSPSLEELRPEVPSSNNISCRDDSCKLRCGFQNAEQCRPCRRNPAMRTIACPSTLPVRLAPLHKPCTRANQNATRSTTSTCHNPPTAPPSF